MIHLPQFEMGSRIPRVIHQTYSSKKRLPTEIQDNIRKICRLNSNWEHRFYEDVDVKAFILKTYGIGVLDLYNRINFSHGAARADLFRYLLIYAEGGVYLDIKSSVTRPLDDVIARDDCLVLSKWENHRGWGRHVELGSINRGEYQQWHIIARAGHPFLRAVIERVIDNIQHYNIFHDGVGRPGSLKVTGPIAYTMAVENIKTLHPFREVDIRRDLGIAYSVYEAPDQKRSHKQTLGEHYSKLKSPIINPRGFRDYFLMILYYIWHPIREVARKVLPAMA